MKKFTNALVPELLKLKRSPIVWITFAGFALGPVMGGLALYLLDSSNAVQAGSMLGDKARLMSLEADWNSYFTVLSQVVGVGGVIIFGFVGSWLFGREYSDRTAKDLLALPVSRSTIVNAKFTVYLIWCTALLLSNLVLGLVMGFALGIKGFEMELMGPGLKTYFLTALMVLLLGTPVCFMGLRGRGFLAPIGLVVVLLVLAQVIAALGFGHYFPWSVPGLYSGISVEMKETVNALSYTLIGLVAVGGFAAAHVWWNRADQG